MFELVDEVIRSNRKTVELRVNSNGRVQLRIPQYADKKSITDFIHRKKNWILKQKAKTESKQFERNYADGEMIYYLGEKHEIVHKSLDNSVLEKSGDKIFFDPEYKEFGKDCFKHWFTNNAKATIVPIAWDLSRYMKIELNAVKISSAEKRWGSCSSKGNINLSYMLMMLPPATINYVIIHELMHIFIPNHSKKFWELVARAMPDYKREIKWIDDNMHLLKL